VTNMNKKSAMSLALLAVGIVLIVFGINANNSVSSGFSRAFTGSPTNKATWLLVGGIACSALGVAGLFWGRKA
jgi:uncharacterized membrane protein YidH (DUF202 family)